MALLVKLQKLGLGNYSSFGVAYFPLATTPKLLSPSSPIRVGVHYLCTHVLDLLPVRPLAPRLSQLPFQLSHSSLQTSDLLFCSASGHGFSKLQYSRGQVRKIRTGCATEPRLQFSASRNIFPSLQL